MIRKVTSEASSALADVNRRISMQYAHMLRQEATVKGEQNLPDLLKRFASVDVYDREEPSSLMRALLSIG